MDYNKDEWKQKSMNFEASNVKFRYSVERHLEVKGYCLVQYVIKRYGYLLFRVF